jgi:5-methyltetrahydrofolate--homocysteine methyltransferase
MSTYKKDWKEAQQRMTDWWEGRKVDRVVASVTAPLPASAKPRSAEVKLKVPDKYCDFDTVFNNVDYHLERTFFGAEAFPLHSVYFGPMFCATYLGCEPQFADNTVWYEPCCGSVDELLKVRFDPNNRWWKLNLEMMRRSLRRSEGRYFVTTINCIMAVVDTVAQLLGTEKLLIAMLEEPEKLKSACDRISAWGRETSKELCDMAGDLGIDYMGVWSPRPAMTEQCDFCVMISPKMFKEFVVDGLESTFSMVDYGIYHLDGAEEFKHLDDLLAIKKLRLIQWQPGSKMANPHWGDALNWIDLFKRIQAAGKAPLIYCAPEQVKPLLNQIDRSLVYLGIGCPDEKSAVEMIRELERIGV